MENKQVKKLINDYEMNKTIAESIIKMIEENNVKAWRKTWQTFRDSDDLYYAVINGEAAAILYKRAYFYPTLYGLPIEPAPGFYVTFNDIKRNKLKLKKGSKGIPTYRKCCFEKYLTKAQDEVLQELLDNPDDIEDLELKQAILSLIKNPVLAVKVHFIADGKEFEENIYFSKRANRYVYLRVQWVLEYYFNNNDLVEPVDVAKLWGVGEENTTSENERIEAVEEVKESYIKRANLKYSEVFQDRAFYRPSEHSVVLPKFTQFENAYEFYGTMFHEFAHSTGHQTLLNRKTLTTICGFRSPTYSKEELVAELSATFTLSALGMLTDELLANSIAYLKSWGDSLSKGIRFNIENTIEHSRRATNLILDIQ